MKKLLFLLLLVPMFAQADDHQDQVYANDRVRPYAELMRDMKNFTDSNIAGFDTVYADNCAGGAPKSWQDDRNDGVPNKLTPNDLCAVNAFWHDFQNFIIAESGGSNTNYNALIKAVVRKTSVTLP